MVHSGNKKFMTTLLSRHYDVIIYETRWSKFQITSNPLSDLAEIGYREVLGALISDIQSDFTSENF